MKIASRSFKKKSYYLLVAVTLSGILKAKQKLGLTFNFNKLKYGFCKKSLRKGAPLTS